jgi:hypothetical protein
LQDVAEEGVDGALERSFDDEMIGDGAVASERGAGVAEQAARGVGEGGAAGFELFERPQPRFAGGPRCRIRSCSAAARAPPRRSRSAPASSRACIAAASSAEARSASTASSRASRSRRSRSAAARLRAADA